MIIAKEVTNLILDNIDKDILDLSFLRELKDYLSKYNYDDLSDYVSCFCYDSSIPAMAMYLDKTIYVNEERIIDCFSGVLSRTGLSGNKVAHNVLSVHTLMHEIMHAYQDKVLFDYKNGKCKDIDYARIMRDSIESLNGLRYSKFYKKYYYSDLISDKNLRLYEKNHDIFPLEINAIAASSLYILDTLNLIKDEEIASKLKSIMICQLTRSYNIKDKIKSPISEFYKKIKFAYDEKAFDIAKYSLVDKYKLGLLEDEEEIYEVFKPYLLSDITKEEFISWFKNTCSVKRLKR